MAARKRLYLVREHIVASPYGLSAGAGHGSNARIVLACDSEEKAIGEACRLEKEAHKVLPPFYAGQPQNWSSLWPQGLIFELEKLGLRDLPDPNVDNWRASSHWQRWWDEHGGELTPEQVEAIWKLFDQLEFYSVARVSIE